MARTADILVAAIGRPGFVTRDFVKPGATVIDVGINALTDEAEVERLFPGGQPQARAVRGEGQRPGRRCPSEVEEVAGALTPVPGGVGPADGRDGAAQHRHGRRRLSERSSERRRCDPEDCADRRHCDGEELRRQPAARGRRAGGRRRRAGARGGGAGHAGRWRRSASASAPMRCAATAPWIASASAQIVFKDKRARLDLEAIIHPAVQQGHRRVLRAAAQAHAVCRRRHPAAVRDRPRQGSSTRSSSSPARARCRCSG